MDLFGLDRGDYILGGDTEPYFKENTSVMEGES
jgi:hypothetical protein